MDITTITSIYLRDHLACVYCGQVIEDEECAGLLIDDVTGGDGNTHPSNLVTACVGCHSARMGRSLSEFALEIAGGGRGTLERKRNAEAIIQRVGAATRRQPKWDEAREMIAAREAEY